jgi:hypothetical protein
MAAVVVKRVLQVRWRAGLGALPRAVITTLPAVLEELSVLPGHFLLPLAAAQ